MTLCYAENGPMKDIYIKSLDPLNVRAKTCARMIKLKVLRWGDDPSHPGGSSIVIRVLPRGKQISQEQEMGKKKQEIEMMPERGHEPRDARGFQQLEKALKGMS